jgi:hypothetical protein
LATDVYTPAVPRVTFIFGNASALAADQARSVAGAASAVLGVAQAVAMSVASPLAIRRQPHRRPYHLGDDRRYHRLADRVPRPCPARRMSRAFPAGPENLDQDRHRPYAPRP